MTDWPDYGDLNPADLDPEQREMIARAQAADRDYSQSGEQAAILGAAAELDLTLTRNVARFLDIGAGDGETYSNTRALALAGWQGVCIEPAAWAFDRLLELYDDSDVRCCSAVVTSDHCGPISFLYSQDDHLSTVEPEHAATWSQVPFKPMTAAAITLEQLLDWFEGGFSVVSIDAEGRTSEILEAYQKHPAWADVRVLCIEHEPNPKQRVFIRGAWHVVTETPNNWIAVRRVVE